VDDRRADSIAGRSRSVPLSLSEPAWQFRSDIGRIVRKMPETREELAQPLARVFPFADLSRDHTSR
jgi:hypothetical protein